MSKFFVVLFSVILLFGNFTRANEMVFSEGTKKFYETGIEKERLLKEWGRLEKARVELILNKFLPKKPAIIADVGGGMGVYAFSLAKEGHTVYLIDPIAINVEEVKKMDKEGVLKDCIIGDAREINLAGGSVDVVLFFGPLYHLDEKNRQIALSEAYRILKPGGLIFAQGISKHCVLLNAFFDGKIKNSDCNKKKVDISLESKRFEYHQGVFYTHTPEELKKEIEQAGFNQVNVMAVEGFAKWLPVEYWEDENVRKDLLYFIEKTEQEPSIQGMSPHIMAIGRKK